MLYELLLEGGKQVTWEGKDPVDASYRYVDAHPGTTVVATRKADQTPYVCQPFPAGKVSAILWPNDR